MEKDIKKMNENLKGLYQEKKITLSEWKRTLEWYVSGNKVCFCKTCNKPKVSDGLDICYECCNEIRSRKIMTEKNKSGKIKKEAVENSMNKKVRKQIDRGYMIAEKWKQQRKGQEIIDKVLFPEGQQEE